MYKRPCSTISTVAVALLVAGATTAHAFPYDHLTCHKMKDPNRFFDALVNLSPLQRPPFANADGCEVKPRATELCTAVSKEVVSIRGAMQENVRGADFQGDLLCYKVKCPGADVDFITMTDQFGSRTISKVKRARRLCVPAIQGPPTICEIRFRLDDTTTLGALQISVDYSATGGEFTGADDDVECRSLAGDSLAARNDIEASDTLNLVALNTQGEIAGPAEIVACEFTPGALLATPDDFVVAVVDSNGTTPLTNGGNVCGAPVTGQAPGFTSDAQLILAAGVFQLPCDPCECDVDGSGTIGPTDALLAARSAAGLPVTHSCPACSGAPVVTGPSASETVSVSLVGSPCIP